MSQNDYFVGEDRFEKTLIKADNVSLIRIPPPLISDALVLNISDWDLEDVVWSGHLKFVETEFIMNPKIHNLGERQIIQGNVYLLNNHGDTVFGVIPYTLDGNNIKVTNSKSLYSVILEHQDKRIGFGLRFADRNKSQEFNMALQDYRRDAKASLATHDEFVNDLEEGVKRLDIGVSSPGSDAPTEELLPNPEIQKISEGETDESDLEFGDFVTSEQ